jgi:hypothetical protein
VARPEASALTVGLGLVSETHYICCILETKP